MDRAMFTCTVWRLPQGETQARRRGWLSRCRRREPDVMSRDISAQLPAVVRRYLDAVNAFDTDAVLATFTADAVVNDNHREFADTAAIRTWIAQEITGDRVTMEVTDADVRP